MIWIKKSNCQKCALLYLLIPTIIFLLSFVKPIMSIPAVCILLYLLVQISRKYQAEESTNIKVRKTVLAVTVSAVILWCYFGGQGGLYYQSDDWFARNAVFRDLINHSWPVYYEITDTMLCYYIGHWLPAALIGKLVLLLSGNADLTWRVANIALWIWTAAGIWITILMIWFYCESNSAKAQLRTLLIVVFFSGLDVIGVLIDRTPDYFFKIKKHLEWWAYPMQFSSNTTCLFWVFNQAVPAWIATVLMLFEFKSDRSIRFMGFVVLTTLICSPLPCLGILVYCAGYSINNLIINGMHQTGKELKNILSIENILSATAILPFIGSYYLMNASFQATTQGERSSEKSRLLLLALIASIIISVTILFCYFPKIEKKKRIRTCYGLIIFIINYNLVIFADLDMVTYLIFLILEIGVFLIILYKRNRDSVIYYSTILLAALCPTITIGKAHDFCMRASIPAIIVTMTMCIKYYNEYNQKKISNTIRQRCVCVVLTLFLIIGSVTPAVEFYRGISNVLNEGHIALVNDDYKTMDQYSEKGEVASNFVSSNYKGSIFYRFFAK